MAGALFELVLQAPAHRVEAVADALMDELQALSVSVEDADAGSAQETALFGEPGQPAPAAGWQRSTLKALFGGEADARRAAAALPAGASVQSLAAVAEQDWVRLTHAQFTPVEITPSFWVVPSWHQPPAAATRVLRLDPGLAFGTGTHPTTHMCLRWLATCPTADLTRVLDYGAGSGILAIGAALLGAASVDAVDIDPTAVEATRSNAAANGVRIDAGLPDLARGAYALVLANILATPLKLLAPLLAGHVAPGGWLVLAGILERQAGELTAAYAAVGLQLAVADSDDGWALMTARRTA